MLRRGIKQVYMKGDSITIIKSWLTVLRASMFENMDTIWDFVSKLRSLMGLMKTCIKGRGVMVNTKQKWTKYGESSGYPGENVQVVAVRALCFNEFKDSLLSLLLRLGKLAQLWKIMNVISIITCKNREILAVRWSVASSGGSHFSKAEGSRVGDLFLGDRAR